MEEPQRIGLTKEANAYLDEMLDSLNSETESTAEKLIKFDLYRLAVAIAVKNGEKPKLLTETTDSSFRVTELDPDKALFISVEASSLYDENEPIYRGIERLADEGIREFYKAYQKNMDRLPWDKILL